MEKKKYIYIYGPLILHPVLFPLPCSLMQLDVTDHAACQRVVEQVEAEAGRLDVLVNNAGICTNGTVLDVPLDKARLTLEVKWVKMHFF